MRRLLPLLLCLLAAPALAQEFSVPPGLSEDALARTLAADVAARKPDPDTLLRAQLVLGRNNDALATLARLRAPWANDASPRVRARDLEYVLYARGDYRKSFRTLIGPLDDRTAAIAVNNLDYDNLSGAEQALAHDLTALKGKTGIALADAEQLVRDYADRQVYRALAATVPQSLAEDDAGRYVTQKDVQVRTPDGATVCALIVRPRGSAHIPALLQFTIYADPGALRREARRAASNGYAGVMGMTRGKGCSPDTPVPYEHDGVDAAALIDWIAAQPWSDGKVGMYGGSYSGFTPFAAAKHHPRALKAIMAGASAGPGIDVPMDGNAGWNFIYPWPFYTTDNKTLDNATYGQSARWAKLDHDYYASGRAYRDLDKIDGVPNPIFDKWISHPSYDAYWQSMIPYGAEWARIDIPVLQTAGYYFGGPGAVTYYLSQHYRYRPQAQHYLVIGPYDHFMGQRGTATPQGNVETLAGYTLDPAALIDLTELRYRWFDYVLKGAPKPAILADRINYEVTGANVWRHAPSLAAMADTRLRYYLSGGGRLSLQASSGVLHQTVDFADRRDVDVSTPGGGVRDKAVDASHGLLFISAPVAKPTELSGLFAGRLDFTTNKKDFDFQISLYEKTAAGDYIQLAPFWERASYNGDHVARHLLVPGTRTSLDFHAVRLMSRKLAAGSRLVAVLQLLKATGRQINYGSGKPVSDETIADAKVPLKIDWYTDSYIDVPARN